MFKKITSVFSKKPQPEKPEFYAIVSEIVSEIKGSRDSNYFSVYGIKFSDLKSYTTLKNKNATYKKEFTAWLVKDIVRIYKLNKGGKSHEMKYESEMFDVQEALLPILFRSNLELSDTECSYYLSYFKNEKFNNHKSMTYWPTGFLVQQIERKIKKGGASDVLVSFLKESLTWEEFNFKGNYYGPDLGRVKKKIESLVFENSETETKVKPFQFNADPFGSFANTILAKADDSILQNVVPILNLSIKVSGAKPSKKFLSQTSSLIDNIDFAKYKQFIYELLEKAIELQPREEVHTTRYGDHEYTHSTYDFIEKDNVTTLKGLVWTLSKFHDAKTLRLLSKLTERCFKKIPGVGPTAAALGNACIYVLANTKGMDGIGQLTVLKQRIKQTSTKKLIERYINELSYNLGISKSDIEESVVQEFGLELGYREEVFEDYKFTIQLERIGKVNSTWVKPDGKIQKTSPSFIKNSKTLSNKLKKIKAEVKEIQKFLTSQRDRLDSLFIEEKVISYINFQKYYFNHGLVSFLTRKLLWIISKGDKKVTAFYLHGHWVSHNKKVIDWIDEECDFQLWHPIYANTEEVLEWRRFLMSLQIVQPLKQAFREIYVLTPAEVNTKVYSNRMASHIIKQHQFNMLAKLRNWDYQLIGAWDHGSDCIARKVLDKTGITAEYWTTEIFDDNQINDSGILLYMSTDQVRFTDDGDPIDLIDVPAIIFSEIMRDVDLFVGVCSVGNDPEWNDNGGMPQYRDYWHSYSFGNLTEVAKTRKTILENLIPRLKIKDIAKVDGKFLVVKGKLRTYKIHIGSTNILMEPNDQYLCIVPSGKRDVTDKVYLPFEGDKGLSVILSKAFLLADDDKITDTTITAQINR